MTNKTYNKLITKTAIYGFTIALVYYIIKIKNYSITVSLTDGPLELQFDGFFEPFIAFLVTRYLMNFVEHFLIGKLIRPTKNLLQGISFIGPIWIFSMSFVSLEWLNLITFYLLIYLSGSYVLNLARVFSKEKKNNIIMRVVSFFDIAFSGYLISVISGRVLNYFVSNDYLLIQPNIVNQFSLLIFISSIIAGFFFLGALLSNYENPYISYFAKSMKGNPLFNGLKILLFFVYLSFGRPYVADLFSSNSQYLSYFEWGAISLFAILTFRNVRSYVSRSMTKKDSMGDWQKHLQVIDIKSDYRLDRLVRIINDFIEKGRNDILLVYLLNMLSYDNLEIERTAKAFHDLIYYQKIDLDAVDFSWNIENLHLEDQKRRAKIVSNLIPEIEKIHSVFGSNNQEKNQGSK